MSICLSLKNTMECNEEIGQFKKYRNLKILKNTEVYLQ